MGVDEARDHQHAGGIDHLDPGFGGRDEIAANGRNRSAFHQNVADRRLVEVLLEVEDAAAAGSSRRSLAGVFPVSGAPRVAHFATSRHTLFSTSDGRYAALRAHI